jgi:hypothetical protein
MLDKMYKKFFIILLLSYIIMYIVSFLNVAEFSHIDFALTRVYMVFLIVAPMAVLMIFFMKDMYKNEKMNNIIIIGSILIFIIALTFLRTQMFIGDEAYMRAMIPHHSSAILNSREANIQDPEVRELADEIIRSQEEEIAEMKKLLYED